MVNKQQDTRLKENSQKEFAFQLNSLKNQIRIKYGISAAFSRSAIVREISRKGKIMTLNIP